MRITRAKVTQANQQYMRPEDNFMSIELFVQPHTVITILGPMPQEPQQPVNYQPIQIQDAGRVVGPVVLTGYVRLTFASVVTNNSTYGSGVVTDAVRYKLNVFITSFDELQAPMYGSHISIQGHLRRTETQQIILQVAIMAQIQVVDNEVLSAEDMRAGFRVPERLRILPENDNLAPAGPVRRPIGEVEDGQDEVAHIGQSNVLAWNSIMVHLTETMR